MRERTRRRSLLAWAAGLTAVLALATGGRSASAASTYTLLSTSDGPSLPCATTLCPNLRSAIAAADNNPGATITLTAGSTYSITAALPDITESMTITSTTAGSRATIDGGSGAHDYRILTVTGAVSLTLADLVISHGTLSGSGVQSGGGIHTDGGVLTLRNVLVTANSVRSAAIVFGFAPAYGGGIDVVNGSLRMTGGGVTDNVLQTSPMSTDGGSGGGVNVRSGSATFTGVTVSGNAGTASSNLGSGSGMRGGGVYVCCGTTSDLTMSGGAVTSNSVTSGNANGGGAGVCCPGMTASFSDMTFSGNSLHGLLTTGGTAGGGFGGGLSTCCGATVTVTRVTVKNNQVIGSGAYGGGIAACCTLDNSGPADSLTIRDSTVSGNTITGDHGQGAGIATCCNTSTLTIIGTTIDHNSGSGSHDVGGGVGACCGDTAQSGSHTSITNSTIAFNTLTGPSSLGGGVGNADTNGRDTFLSKVTLDNVTVNGNSAASGANLGAGATNHSIALVNTIVAGSPGSNCATANGGSITSQGHNLDDGTSCGLKATGDLASTDPQLGPLQVNSPGATATESLMSSSRAANSGSNAACPATDQRGVTRTMPSDPVCDMGAFEAAAPPPATTPPPVVATQPAIVGAPQTGGGEPMLPIGGGALGSAAVLAAAAAGTVRRRRVPMRDGDST